MQFQGWVSLDIDKISPKWINVVSHRVDRIDELDTPKKVLVWSRKNIDYAPDIGDTWQTPEETLSRKAGDCEDFVILMRALLIASGFDSSKMWMLIGHDLISRQDHSVLVFEDFVLDCRSDIVFRLSEFSDFMPIVAYSDDKAMTFGRKI